MPDMFIELDRHEAAEHQTPPRRLPLGRRARPWVAALVAVALLAFGSASAAPRPTLEHVVDILVQAEAELISIGQTC